MYLMYVDESGDTGLIDSPTRYFILSAIVLHELEWRSLLQNLVQFKRHIKNTKGLRIREEIHCKDLISKPGELVRIKRNDRLDIIKQSIKFLATEPSIKIFSVVIDKNGRTDDIFDLAWNTLLNRFERTIIGKGFIASPNQNDKGIVVADNTDAIKLRALLRKMRHFNMIAHNRIHYGAGARNVIVQNIIEDPVLRDSQYSFIHQMCDVVAYCLRQKFEPNAYMKKHAASNLYERLEPVLLKVVSAQKNGIVFI